MGAKCPYCDFVAENSDQEILHVEKEHPGEIQKRIQQAEMVWGYDLRQGPDLPSFLTLKELRWVCDYATRLTDDEDAMIAILVRDRGVGSDIPAPWVEFAVGRRELAIWRRSGELYEVSDDGTIGDEPLYKRD